MIADPFEYDDDSPHLPSPTDLMGKILLKVSILSLFILLSLFTRIKGKMLEKSMFECEEDDVNKPGVKIAHGKIPPHTYLSPRPSRLPLPNVFLSRFPLALF